MATDSIAQENSDRRSMRLALGVSVSFLIAQAFAWPLAFSTPVFVALLLQEPNALPLRTGLQIITTALSALLIGYLLALFLYPYPAVMMLVYCAVLYRLYIYMLTAGAHLLAFVGVIIGATVIPILMGVAPDIAAIVGWGFALTYVVSLLLAWSIFLLVPAPAGVAPAPLPARLPMAAAAPIAAGLVVVIAPLMTAFLLFGWTDILVLAFALLIAAAMSAEKSAQTGGGLTLANLALAGVLVVLAYELLVIAPGLPFMVALIFGISLLYGRQIFSGKPAGGLWSTGLTGFLILLGGALMKEDVYISANLLNRVGQIFLATLYVVFAYRIVELLSALRTGRTRST